MPPDQELSATEALIDEILDQLQNLISSGEVLPEDLVETLAQVLSDSADRIAELTEEIQPTETPIESAPPTGADLLWILSGGQEDAFVNYLRTFPDPALNQLVRNPAQLSSTIERLNRTMPQGEQPQQDGIPHAPLNSSNVYGFQYDPKSGKLMVRFQGGSVYGYDNVPPGVFKVFQQGAVPAKTSGQNRWGKWWRGKIPSLGAAFYELIRQGGYPYQKLK